MSSVSWIGRKTENGAEYIYCHLGGYYDENGKTLYENYICDDDVEELLALGDASYIGIDITKEQSCFYSRDRGENLIARRKDVDSNFRPNAADSYELCFLWNKGEWWVSGAKNRAWCRLSIFNLDDIEGVFHE